MLPNSWIEKIFTYMSGLYGSKFSDLWRGSDLNTVKQLWAEKLGGFEPIPGAIKEALDALDGKPFPPTLPEFLELCRESARRQTAQKPMLEHKPTPEEIKRGQEAASKLYTALSQKNDHKAWARRLKARNESGEKLSLLQIQGYQDALRYE